MKRLVKNTFLYLGLAFMLFAFSDIKLSKGVWKKIDKAISKVWEEENALKDQVMWSDMSLEKVSLKGVELLYLVSDANQMALGYMVISQAPSRYDQFDIMVLYDLEIKIVKTEILVYREDWGGEISSPRWLRQFEGKTANDRIELSHGIQGISGATISCKSAVDEIDRLTQLMTQLNQSGQLFAKN